MPLVEGIPCTSTSTTSRQRRSPPLITTLIALAIMCRMLPLAEGLPVHRQERSTEDEVLSGADFLSVLMRSPNFRIQPETSSEITTTLQDILESTLTSTTINSGEAYIRQSRSTPHDSLQSISNINSSQLDDSDSGSTDPVIVEVRVSSSVGKRINKVKNISEIVPETTTGNFLYPFTEYSDQVFVASEEHPSIVAESSKSEFVVDEGEPITKNTNDGDGDGDGDRNYNSGFSRVNFERPLHQTIIYHDNPREPNRARSVSYSTVIQSLPQTNTQKVWAQDLPHHDRRERHYNDDTNKMNNFNEEIVKKNSNNENKPPPPSSSSVAESNHYYITAQPVLKKENDIKWSPGSSFRQAATSPITTEKNWEKDETSYHQSNHQLPTVYEKPEQNYEVDESASVNSNGRVHGIQSNHEGSGYQKIVPKDLDGDSKTPLAAPDRSSKKEDHHQNAPPAQPNEQQRPKDKKFGYVVEGRNYRKYRVEERTSDGFIVGEYGVVSHDDGSLRGVRYTADGDINPKLIYDALMKFLAL